MSTARMREGPRARRPEVSRQGAAIQDLLDLSVEVRGLDVRDVATAAAAPTHGCAGAEKRCEGELGGLLTGVAFFGIDVIYRLVP
jgi:hypothetical protein